MAYIFPESSITFCSLDIPLTSDYQNTILFESETEQLNYFSSKAVRVLDNYSVIKKEAGFLKVSGSYADWLNVNYCYFTNPNFSNKIFYAFVDMPEYIAPNTTKIRISIDYIQTYFLFNCNFRDCLIDRETVAEDTLENCLVEESIGLGDYEWMQETYADFDAEVGDRVIVAAFTPTEELETQLADGTLVLEPPGYYGGQYIPFYWGLWTETSQEPIERLITALEKSGQTGSIIGMWYFYEDLIPTKAEEGIGRPVVLEQEIEKPLSWETLRGNSLNGYIPKNNKLYTFPYCYLELNGYGQEQDLKYEYVGDAIKLYAPFTPGSQMFIWPNFYNGQANDLDAGVSSKSLPLYGYAVNAAYNNYMTSLQERAAIFKNKKISTALELGETFVGTIPKAMGAGVAGVAGGIAAAGGEGYGLKGSGVLAGGMAGGGIGYLGDIYHMGKTALHGDLAQSQRVLEGQLSDALRAPTDIQNQNAIPELNFVLGYKTPFIVGKTQKRYRLEIIDNFFSMYGYKVDRYGKPNLKSRKSWNYIKLAVCNVYGKINEEDLMAIKGILENGITFWHTTDVGNYSLDNSII